LRQTRSGRRDIARGALHLQSQFARKVERRRMLAVEDVRVDSERKGGRVVPERARELQDVPPPASIRLA
jgi:hypothetical protein